jgi:transglutaminase-like putative cysteine protease
MRTLEILHRTRYEYKEPVTLGEYRLMFRPRDSHDLRMLDTSLAIEPQANVRYIHDPFGNSIAIAAFDGETQVLEFVSTIKLEHFGVRPELPPIEAYAQKLPFAYVAEEAPDLVRYVERAYPDPNAAVSAWARQFLESDDGGETFATLSRMCATIHTSFKYAVRFEDGTQPPAQTLELGGGTCRDFALLMMEGARSLGLAARFVTGYLYDPALDMEPGKNADSAYPHAWMEVYLPGAGWMEFDPTNGIIGTDRLIRVAVARDSEQAMPIKGSFVGVPGACTNTIVDVQVRTLTPAPEPAAIPQPAVTRPLAAATFVAASPAPASPASAPAVTAPPASVAPAPPVPVASAPGAAAPQAPSGAKPKAA